MVGKPKELFLPYRTLVFSLGYSDSDKDLESGLQPLALLRSCNFQTLEGGPPPAPVPTSGVFIPLMGTELHTRLRGRQGLGACDRMSIFFYWLSLCWGL